MDSFSLESSSQSAVFTRSLEEQPTWFSVDLRFVIAAIVVFGVVVATTIRFSHEVFDPLADALKLQGWTAIVVRPSLLWFTMGMVLIVVRTLLWVRYRPMASVSAADAPRMSVIMITTSALLPPSRPSAAAGWLAISAATAGDR